MEAVKKEIERDQAARKAGKNQRTTIKTSRIGRHSVNLPKLPSRLEDWNMEILNRILDIHVVESDIFDLKGQGREKKNLVPPLAKHFCAMANTNGGTIVLGIDTVRDPEDTQKILGYEKNGYDIGTEDAIGLKISHEFLN
ncbi:MAG TPA: ATP-binding protein [Nitrososphaera sp.]|nr:ATP-binding protein [Nitrososphaera sp.]